MEPKPFRLHSAEGANNHVEQGDNLVFAGNPIDVTYDQLVAMLTIPLHIFPLTLKDLPTKRKNSYQIDLLMYRLVDENSPNGENFYKYFSFTVIAEADV